MMSAISLDFHVLKVNPLLNIRVPTSMSRFFVISLNRELCSLEIIRLVLNEGEVEIYDAETWEAQYL